MRDINAGWKIVGYQSPIFTYHSTSKYLIYRKEIPDTEQNIVGQTENVDVDVVVIIVFHALCLVEDSFPKNEVD